MKHFLRLPLKVFILSFLTLQKTDATKIIGRLPSIPAVAQFLNEFIRPIIENHGTPNFRANGDNSFIKKIIHDKIKELKPILQDHDTNEGHNTVTLEGDEDTHILEFIPSSKQALRYKNQTADVEKFKKMQKKIKKVLNKEPISEDTKMFITKSVDEMVAHIVSNKCVWTTGKAALRLGNQDSRKPFTFNHMWSHLLEKIQKRYKETGNDAHSKNKHNLKQLQQFVSEILNDTQVLSEDYRVVCSVVNINNLNVAGLRTLNNEVLTRSKQRKNPYDFRAPETTLDTKNIDENETCPYFKVCSEELSDFMIDFYINLNDTAVSTLTNYAAMFVRDVKEDHNNEKQTVIKLINDTSFRLAKKINIIFKKQTEKFSLDKSKDKNSNINSLRQYIKKTVNHVKRQVINDVAVKLNELRPKLRLTIEKDIDVNLDVDLGNLEKELSAKICTVFEICNGKYVSRRSIDYGGPKIDKNHLFVRVQLTLDDKKKPDRKIAVGVGQAMRSNGLSTHYNKYVSLTRTDAPFPTSNAPFTTSNVPFTTSNAPFTTSNAPFTTTLTPFTTTIALSTKTDALSTRNVATTRESDTLSSKIDTASTTLTSKTETTYRETRFDTMKISEKSTKPEITPVYANIVQSNVKLTSAEVVKNNTAKTKHKKHDKNIAVKFVIDKTNDYRKTKTKKFRTIESLETYHETQLDVFTEKISTDTEKNTTNTEKNLKPTEKKLTSIVKISMNAKDSNMTDEIKKKKHRVKKYKDTKYNHNSTTKFKTIESLETYRETLVESQTEKTSSNTKQISNLNTTADEHLKKKKHRDKKHHSSNKHPSSKKNLSSKKNKNDHKDEIKESESKETVLLGKGEINLKNEKVHHKSQHEAVKTEVGKIQNNTNTTTDHEHTKPSDLLGKQGIIDTVNVTELRFNMTLGSLGAKTKHHIEKHHRSEKHDQSTEKKENKERNKETNSENIMFYKRSRDVNDAESSKTNSTLGEHKERRNGIFNNSTENINFVEHDDDYYYYDDYENSTEILDQNGLDQMKEHYESERGVNNKTEALNRRNDDVMVYNVKRGTYVDLDDNKA